MEIRKIVIDYKCPVCEEGHLLCKKPVRGKFYHVCDDITCRHDDFLVKSYPIIAFIKPSISEKQLWSII